MPVARTGVPLAQPQRPRLGPARAPAIQDVRFRQLATQLGAGLNPDLIGTVIASDVFQERPDFDGIAFLNRLLLLIELLGLPVFLLWYILNTYGPVSFFLGLLALYMILRYLMPGNLFAALGIFHIVDPGRRNQRDVQTQYCRVRTGNGSEHLLRRKGRLRSGHLQTGDRIAAWGQYRAGTLFFDRGINLTTNSLIEVDRGWSHVVLCAHLLILALILAAFVPPLRATLEHIRSVFPF
jgi:hypothetical protein